MTVEQKLSRFAEYTQQKVEEECRKTSQEVQEALKMAINKAGQAARQQKQNRIQEERQRLERESFQRINAASMAAKHALSELRERLADELFAALEADLYDFADSPDYEDFMARGILKAMDDFRFVQLMKRDMYLAPRIEEKTSLRVEGVNEDFIGGFRLVSENRRMEDDHTILTRIQDIRGDFSL